MLKDVVSEVNQLKYFWKRIIPLFLLALSLGAFVSKYAPENPALLIATILFFLIAIALVGLLIQKEWKVFHAIDAAVLSSRNKEKETLSDMRHYIVGTMIFAAASIFPLFITASLICKILFIGKFKDLQSLMN